MQSANKPTGTPPQQPENQGNTLKYAIIGTLALAIAAAAGYCTQDEDPQPVRKVKVAASEPDSAGTPESPAAPNAPTDPNPEGEQVDTRDVLKAAKKVLDQPKIPKKPASKLSEEAQEAVIANYFSTLDILGDGIVEVVIDDPRAESELAVSPIDLMYLIQRAGRSGILINIVDETEQAEVEATLERTACKLQNLRAELSGQESADCPTQQELIEERAPESKNEKAIKLRKQFHQTMDIFIAAYPDLNDPYTDLLANLDGDLTNTVTAEQWKAFDEKITEFAIVMKRADAQIMFNVLTAFKQPMITSYTD